MAAARRIDWIEWLRAAGCVAIVALHVFVSLVNAVGVEALGPLRYGVLAVSSVVLTRWAVPAFLMVSGMLLLDPTRQIDGRRLWGYACRMLFVLGTFGLLFCLIESVVGHGGLNLAVVGEAVVHLLTGRSWDHLWYVYALLGLYALTPALRALVRRLSERTLGIVLAVLYVVVLVLPTLSSLVGRPIATPFNIVPAVFYYLLGWYAHCSLRLGPLTVGAGIVSALAMALLAACGRDLLSLPEYCLVAPWGVLVFLAFRAYATAPIADHPLAATLASCSFGIYVIHPLFIHVLLRLVDPLAFPAGVYELAVFALSLAGSLASVLLLRRLPGFSRYL